MIIIDVEQGTPEWHEARLGIPTASRFKEIVTPAKAELSKTSETYLRELLAEWLSGQPTESFSSSWMQRGQELESPARTLYQFEREIEVRQVGFCRLGDLGYSPDGLCGGDGLLEIKCPKPSTHIGYLMEGVLPTEYRAQVMGGLLITDRNWCDFLSYCPGMPPLLVRVDRDDKYIAKLKSGLDAFLTKLYEGRESLTQKGYVPELKEAA